MASSVDVSGAVAFRRAFSGMAEDLEDLTPLHRDLAAGLVRAMSPPRRTGALARSVSHKAGPTGLEVAYGARYAGYVHWGTRRMAGRPWATDALENRRQTILGGYADELQELCNEVHRKANGKGP
jgi:hypothetical protein